MGIGAHGTEGADDLAQVNIRKQFFCGFVQFPQTFCCCRKGTAQWLAETADQQVPLHAGNGCDALAAVGRLMVQKSEDLRKMMFMLNIIRGKCR